MSGGSIFTTAADHKITEKAGPPVVTDDVNADFDVGDIIIDTVASPREGYKCTNNAAGAAVWEKTTTAGEAAAPLIHAATHENTGSDEINVGGLSGVLADPQPSNIGLVSDLDSVGDLTFSRADPPTVDDDSTADWVPGDILIETGVAPPVARILVDNTVGAAVWVLTTRNFPPNHINNLALAYASVATINVAVGECRDSTDIFDIVNGIIRSADITTGGAGGLDTGAEAADTWYAVHIIADSSGVNSTDTLLSLSATAPTLPAGYDVFRHIGWIRNDSSSNILQFITDGIGRERLVEYQNVTRVNLRILNNGSAVAMTAVDLSSLVPTTSKKARMIGLAQNTSDNRNWAIAHGDSTLAQSDQPIRFGMNKDTGGFDTGGTAFDILINASQEVVYGASNSNVDLDLFALGYYLVI